MLLEVSTGASRHSGGASRSACSLHLKTFPCLDVRSEELLPPPRVLPHSACASSAARSGLARFILAAFPPPQTQPKHQGISPQHQGRRKQTLMLASGCVVTGVSESGQELKEQQQKS